MATAVPAFTATAIVGGLLAVGSQFDDMVDTIRVGTGATGDALSSLEDSAKSVGKNVTQSFADTGEAIADVNKSLGLTGEPLEKLSTQFLNLSEVTGTDLKTNISNVSRAFGDWGVTVNDQSDVLDYFFKTSQKTGSSVDEISQRVVQFGAPMRGMGFSLKETAALLGEFQQKGVNTELVMGSMRIALGKFAKAGEDAPATLRRTIEEIKTMPDATEAAGKAAELFGQRAGSDMADTIRGGKFEIDSLMASIEGSQETIGSAANDTRDFAESWSLFKNQAMLALEPIATRVFGILSLGMGWIAEHGIPTMQALADAVGPTLNAAITDIGNAFSAAFGFFSDHEEAAKRLGIVLGVVLTPVIVDLGVQATISAASQVAAWTTSAASAVASSATSLAAHYSNVAGWILHSGTAIKSGAETAAIWLLIQGDAISSAATSVAAHARIAAAWVASGLASTVNGAKIAGAWLLSTAQAAGATVATLAYSVATKAVAAASVIWTGVQWALNAALTANPIGLIVLAIAALVGGIILAYQHSETFRDIVQGAWTVIQNVILFAWNSVIKPVWDAFINALQWVGDKVGWLWSNIIQPIFGFIGDLVSAWWSGVQIEFDLFRAAIGFIGDAVNWLWENVIQPVWNGIGNTIKWVIENIIAPAFETMKGALGRVGEFFGSVVEGIRSAWDGVKRAVAVPINFVIETVWNNGLLKAWNTVAGWLPGLKQAEPMAPVAFAQGGATSGGIRGKDSIPALLMPDEHVFDVENVDALGGQANVYALRHMLDLGIPFSWDAVNGLKQAGAGVVSAISTAPTGGDMAGFLRAIGVPGYKDGGAVRPAWEYQLEAGHEYAMSLNHHAYTWGFEDCSGYLSKVADKILGGPGERRWATSSFPGGQPWVAGLGQGMSAAVWDDPGGPGGGHTVGNLSSVGR
ncbi:MAG: phage tail tape measure protein, partial [Actinobacteria bacterium]|nr:phage tail tape measure protein [Actinomycetota bacterium]